MSDFNPFSCYWQISILGNKCRIFSDCSTRAVSADTAVYTRIKDYYDFLIRYSVVI